MGNENSGLKSLYEVIRDHYISADPEVSIYELGLDRKYIEVLERWIFIDIQRSKNYPRKNTKEILTLWRRKYELSEAQFYIDLRNCERLFGETVVINKLYEKKLAIQAYDMILSLALARGDLKSAINAQKRKDQLTQIDKADDTPLETNTGERKYELSINMVLDNKLVTTKNIDITNLQNLPIKEVREIATLVDRPEADIDTMENYLDNLDKKEEDAE